jgi:hypothetical protein
MRFPKEQAFHNRTTRSMQEVFHACGFDNDLFLVVSGITFPETAVLKMSGHGDIRAKQHLGAGFCARPSGMLYGYNSKGDPSL